MRISTSLSRITFLEDSARSGTYATRADEIETYARRALGANGFGDAAVVQYEQLSSARATAPRQTLDTVLRSLGGFASRAYAAWQRKRRARANFLALEALDARTLRDVGLDRSEISSIAAEMAGLAEHTRAQTIRGVARR